MWYPSPSDHPEQTAPENVALPEPAPSPERPVDQIVKPDPPVEAKAASAGSGPGTEYWLP